MAQGMVQHTNDQSQAWNHSAIQAPICYSLYNDKSFMELAPGYIP